MTNQELLHDLAFRSTRLEVSVALLKADVRDLQSRFGAAEETTAIRQEEHEGHETEEAPRAPAASPEELAETIPGRHNLQPPPLPALPPFTKSKTTAQPSVVAVDLRATGSPVSATPIAGGNINEPVARRSTATTGPAFELQFGKWLARIGVVFALLTLVYFSIVVHDKLYHYLGPWSKLSVLALVSSALIATGLRLEKRENLLVYGRTLAGGGLACLYYTIYGAIYVPQLRVIGSPLFGSILLLAWSAGVLWLAEKRRSELLSVFALSLAYFSSAITPQTGFVMAADLILAATAVIFLVRNAWAGLSFLCLIGTYLGFLRQAVDYRGPLDFNWSGTLPFWPSAVYLTGAWLIFTAGILLTRAPNFIAGKRMAFLCLNNGAWAGLLVIAAQLGDYPHLGGIFGTVGAAFLVSCAIFRFTHADARDIAGAYFAQGLAFATGGIAIAYSGVTRGLMFTIESVFLVTAGAYSRNIILRIGGAATALLGACFLGNELAFDSHYPWVTTFGGALAMLANAWLARREFWIESRNVANSRIVLSSAFYIVLALGLLLTGVCSHADSEWIAPGLALIALSLAASIYLLPLFELPPLSQVLLVLAQVILYLPALFDGSREAWRTHHGYFNQPQWCHNVVAAVTMLLATWWPRQTLIRTRGWFQTLTVIYAMAMVAFSFESLNQLASSQIWMINAALLSLVFLAYGAWNRLWAFAVAGQILLAFSVATFLSYDIGYGFPWAWWAAAVPIAVVFATAWIAREVLSPSTGISAIMRDVLRIAARVYQSIAVGLLVRWVFGVAPSDEVTLWLIALGTAFLGTGLVLRSDFAIRAGFVLDLVGVAHYPALWPAEPFQPFTWTNAFAFTLLLAQPALVRRWGRELISQVESWVLIVISSAVAWIFVGNSMHVPDFDNLTLGWALTAVALIIIGFAANERRQRWCGLAILVAAFARVGVHDVWGWSDLYKVLTFLVLTVICLGLSFLYYKFADRLKEWL